MRQSLVAALALALISLVQPTLAAPIPANARAAAAYVESVGAEALAALSQPSLSPSTQESRLRAVLDQGLGIPTICQEVVGEAWTQAPLPERQAFCSSFRDYLLGYLIGVRKEETPERFEVIGAERNASGKIEVATKVERQGLSVGAVLWMVRESAEGLEIVDVITNGVSLIATYRSEFGSFVRREGIEALTVALHRKAAQR